MATGATPYHLLITLSDVDRSVYAELDLRPARHPSESMRYFVTRAIAYALSYEDGIAFSREGISSTDEAPVSVRDPTGSLVAWIDVGSPSADRLHKASKAARRVAVFTHVEPALLRKEAQTRPIHKLDAIDVWRIESTFLDALAERFERTTRMELVRTDGNLYATIGGKTIEGTLERVALAERES